MKFKRANFRTANGTSLQGYITATYSQLVELFGTPDAGGDKTQAEWCLKFEDGTVATIYDWKESVAPELVTDWHIGGFKIQAAFLVKEAMTVQA
jgi:hypothetical protein